MNIESLIKHFQLRYEITYKNIYNLDMESLLHFTYFGPYSEISWVRLEEVSQFFKPPKNAQDPQNMGDIELAQSLSTSKEKRPLNAN